MTPEIRKALAAGLLAQGWMALLNVALFALMASVGNALAAAVFALCTIYYAHGVRSTWRLLRS